MSHIHFIGGEKGGVGKSVVARALAQWFIDRAKPFAALDADQSHGVLLRFYGHYAQAVDLSSPDSADQIMDRALGSERSVLVDLPGQSMRGLRSWLNGADIFAFSRELGVGFTFWHVSDGSFASIVEVGQTLDLLGDEVRHIFVKNLGRGKDFSQFDESDTKAQLERLGASIIELPELEASVMYRIDSMGASFWAAANSTDGPYAMRPLDRQRVRLWLRQAYAPLDALTDSL